MEKTFKLNDIVQMKKKHPCGNDKFQVTRVGADIKIKCVKCAHIIMMSRLDFKKRIKKNITEVNDEPRN